ncbi:MAG: amino acid racemase [Burkholderiaceae bacterium]
MKTIGICIPTIEGGVVCHQEIGREAARRGIPYPQIVTHTPLFEVIGRSVTHDDFQSLATVLADSINCTARAGADFAIIPSNTMHGVFDDIARQSDIPVLSILDVAGDHCVEHGYRRVGILGTTPTIQRRLYDAPLAGRGISTVYPSAADQDAMMKIIYHELIRGIFTDASRQQLEDITKRLAVNCDAVVLGCTELPLVLTEEACGTKLVDTTRILAHAALDRAISDVSGR